MKYALNKLVAASYHMKISISDGININDTVFKTNKQTKKKHAGTEIKEVKKSKRKTKESVREHTT